MLWNNANAYNTWRNQTVNMTNILEMAQWDYPVIYKVTAQNPSLGAATQGAYTAILVNL